MTDVGAGATLACIWVPGRPRTKGSLKHWCMKDRAHTVRVEEQVKDSKAWRIKIASHVQRQMLQDHGSMIKFPGPVELRTVYFFCREDEDLPREPYPTAITVGDLDKLDRNVGDALTSSGLIKDDKLIVHGPRGKFWAAQCGVQIMVLSAVTDPVEVEAYARQLFALAGGVL